MPHECGTAEGDIFAIGALRLRVGYSAHVAPELSRKRRTRVLGGPAWTVELAPPQHKPYPMQLVVDAETGLVLQQRNDGFGSVSEWTEFTVGEPMNDDLFSWDGATRSPVEDHALVIAEHEADGRRRSAWFATHVAVLPLRVELSVGVWVHEFDEESGAFQASLGEHQFGMIARRPAGTVGEWE
ncbi:MAG: hypothetical protein QOH56_3469, partial [Pseudonocardiales bacterium]|nr:hypothetical protein [Pseudonocardiales bacterium]